VNDNEGCATAIGVFAIAIFLLLASFFAGYKQGQVDAMDGKWKWVKVKDADGHEYVVEKH
jgi:hypothetical protein